MFCKNNSKTFKLTADWMLCKITDKILFDERKLLNKHSYIKIRDFKDCESHQRVQYIWASKGKRFIHIDEFAKQGFPSFGHGIDSCPVGWNPLCTINRWLMCGLEGPLWSQEQRVPVGYTGQDWWCVKSSPQRGKEEKTLGFPWDAFHKGYLENRLHPWTLANHQMIQNFKGKV